MSEEARLAHVLDEHEIASLLVRWGHARDSGDWDALAACFHDDATIHISWISGPATEFVARSRALAGARPPGTHQKHIIAGPYIRLGGPRAFSVCHVMLHSRVLLDGRLCDLEAHFRFYDLFERRAGRWAIVKRSAVYEKDRLMPTDAGAGPLAVDEAVLARFPAACKFMNYNQVRNGRTPATDIVTVYSEGERALEAEGRRWIGAG